LGDLLEYAGRSLSRKGARYTGIAAGITGGIFAAKFVAHGIGELAVRLFDIESTRITTLVERLSTYNLKMLWIPVAAAVLTYGLGYACRFLANLFSWKKKDVAYGSALDLVEDCVKERTDEHIDIIWERINKYDSALRNSDEDRRDEAARIRSAARDLKNALRSCSPDTLEHYGVPDEGDLDDLVRYIACYRPVTNRLEATKEGFAASVRFALSNSLPQTVEKEITGITLEPLEKIRDGAPFTENDCKLNQLYAGGSAIFEIRRQIGRPILTRLKEALFGNPAPSFFRLTMKKIAQKVGALIDRFNRTYVAAHEREYFNAQHFLWPHPASDKLVEDRFGPEALRALADARKQMIRQTFSDDREQAHRHVYRMLGRDMGRALELSLAYDVERTAGMLDEDPMQDIDELESAVFCEVYSRRKATEAIERAKRNVRTIDAFVEKRMPGLSPFERRAIRIGYHLNNLRLHDLVKKDEQSALGVLADIARVQERCNDGLLQLRLFYELARDQVLFYVRRIDELGQYSQDAPPGNENTAKGS